MTKWLSRIALLPLFVISLMADDWQFQSVFYDYELARNDGLGIHGTVVAPDGNVWVAMHGPIAGDTLFVDDGAGGIDTVSVRPVHVFTPAGAHASFSPIRFPGGEGVDTLTYSGTGMCLDPDGNIIYSTNKLYRFNSQTGEMMHSFDVAYDDAGSMAGLTQPSADQDGNVYVSWVAGAAKPVVKVSADFSSQTTVSAAGINYNRATCVTPDANRIFLGSTWNGVGVTVLEANALGTAYDSVDTYGNVMVMVADTTSTGADTTYQAQVNLWVEALEWNLGVLWAGETDPAWSSHPLAGSWVGLNPNTGAIIDTLGIGQTVLPTDDASALAATGVTCNPRGIGSSADGLTLYVSDFSTNVIQVWTNADPVTVAIDEEGNAPIVAEGYALYQAYPNPFNPSTKIKYEVGRTGNAKMEIFNLKGQLVRTLVNEWHFNGEHEIVWNGRDNSGMRVPSGTYIYRLSSVDVNFSKRVTLLK